MILKTKREKIFHKAQQIMILQKLNLYPMFAVYMYKNIDMHKSKYYIERNKESEKPSNKIPTDDRYSHA